MWPSFIQIKLANPCTTIEKIKNKKIRGPIGAVWVLFFQHVPISALQIRAFGILTWWQVFEYRLISRSEIMRIFLFLHHLLCTSTPSFWFSIDGLYILHHGYSVLQTSVSAPWNGRIQSREAKSTDSAFGAQYSGTKSWEFFLFVICILFLSNYHIQTRWMGCRRYKALHWSCICTCRVAPKSPKICPFLKNSILCWGTVSKYHIYDQWYINWKQNGKMVALDWCITSIWEINTSWSNKVLLLEYPILGVAIWMRAGAPKIIMSEHP